MDMGRPETELLAPRHPCLEGAAWACSWRAVMRSLLGNRRRTHAVVRVASVVRPTSRRRLDSTIRLGSFTTGELSYPALE